MGTKHSRDTTKRKIQEWGGPKIQNRTSSQTKIEAGTKTKIQNEITQKKIMTKTTKHSRETMKHLKNTTRPPRDTTKRPWYTTKRPRDTTKRPRNTTKHPRDTTKRKIEEWGGPKFKTERVFKQKLKQE